jgi:hypothetical protein
MAKLPTHLTAVTISPFIMEVHEVIDALLYRLAELERLSVDWLRASDRADDLVRSQKRDLDQDDFTATLGELGRLQASSFDAVEAFLAVWARLSLLFFPTRHAGTEGTNRGEVLQHIFELDANTSPLADRDLRNAWMHFDERLDQAVKTGILGNRHKFVRSSEGAGAAQHTVRVIEMDTLRVHYRDEEGQPHSRDLRALRSDLHAIESKRPDALRRFRDLYVNDAA